MIQVKTKVLEEKTCSSGYLSNIYPTHTVAQN